MPRPCGICSHRDSRALIGALVNGRSYRSVAAEFGVNIATIANHVRHHIQGPLQRLIRVETNLAKDALSLEPVLASVRRLHLHTEKLLARAEVTDDRDAWLGAIREARANLQLIGRLTGELSDAPAESNGRLEVIVVREQRAIPNWSTNNIVDALPAPEPSTKGVVD
jgi:hypothetical protein